PLEIRVVRGFVRPARELALVYELQARFGAWIGACRGSAGRCGRPGRRPASGRSESQYGRRKEEAHSHRRMSLHDPSAEAGANRRARVPRSFPKMIEPLPQLGDATVAQMTIESTIMNRGSICVGVSQVGRPR